MVEAVFQMNSRGKVKRFVISGHTESVPADQADPVCAAVSFLAQNSINGIEVLTSDEVRYKADDDGYLEASVPAAERAEESERTDLILDLMVLGLESLAAQYSRFVKVKKVPYNRGGALK